MGLGVWDDGEARRRWFYNENGVELEEDEPVMQDAALRRGMPPRDATDCNEQHTP